MNKKQFLRALRRRLRWVCKLDKDIVDEFVAYYSKSIDERRNIGYTEREVIEQLGSPSLVARIIMELGEGKELISLAVIRRKKREWEIENRGYLIKNSAPWELAVMSCALLVLLWVAWNIVCSVVSIVMPFIVPLIIVLTFWFMGAY